MENYDKDDESQGNNSGNKSELIISDLEIEKDIEILQKAINVVISQRKELDKQTESINKRIKYLTQKEKLLKQHCKNQINHLHKVVEIKKKRLQDEILLEQKKSSNQK